MKLGIDLGGTKIEACVLDGSKEVIRRRIDTPKNDYHAILRAINELVLSVDNELQQKLNVGCGTPGALSAQTGLLRNSNTVCMNGKALLEDLKETLNRPVKILNDANCLALSEAVDGAGQGQELVFGVIIGTGTGGGIIYQQKPLIGRHAIAGEWGHNPLPWIKAEDKPLQTCYCGKQGCIETFLSGPGLAKVFESKFGKVLNSREIVQQARQGDDNCKAMMEYYYDCMSRALAHIINVVDPDVIVLGGGLSNIEELYTEVPKRLDEYVFSDHVNTPIVQAKHGDSSGVRGAAWLW
ncbi:MAG: ROK family protein [Gammaproteobacteria bacterium]|nr:ROK family protein [Gammaproteobacteria bacterium]